MFDPEAWAIEGGAARGEPGAAQPPTRADLDGEITVDAVSRIVTVRASVVAVAVERALREQGLTLGLFPERYEVASVADLIAGDDPGAGASGPGFASLVVGRSGAFVHLGVRPRPEAQSGRALVVESLRAAGEALRLLAQDDRLPDLALAADAPAADLLLRVAGDPDRRLGDLEGRALLVLIAAGRHGQAAERADAAVAACAAVTVADLGQNVARGFAASRYDMPRHTAQLASAGFALEVSRTRVLWRDLPAAIAAPGGGAWHGREILGAGPHGAVLQVRSLS
jgi:alkyldihydroxyacetonephosphate synthase